ncbi:uncharacterized protein LOC9636834 [Selaginella moellendorffii]|uniref:uncharacterized protein LOC9636834 n=1 Tax=Selaginella moellendorffii TaxID=88036 RepID=UPI000D1C86F0|nr:uncharacterized protein LOC9636834 [Selaginella moellendorffii]|eukprot:XP_024533388.1 uncharacterized protein LOC9636834 [Selaginella moellendorffii]
MNLLFAFAIYPGSDETSQQFLQVCSNRGVDQQLRMVACTVYLYLSLMLKMVRRELLCDLSLRDSLRRNVLVRRSLNAWFKELNPQSMEVKVDRGASITRRSAVPYLEHALLATKDPKFIVENGLPSEL